MYGWSGTGVPITCAPDEQVTPIKAWTNSPDEPDYLAASNWHCVKKTVMAEQAGFTFNAGLKAWAANPAVAAITAVTMIPNFVNAPGYGAGLLLPLVGIGLAGWKLLGGKR